MGVQELDAKEIKGVNGGCGEWCVALALFLASEWEATKQAAIDAWNGTYNPPQ
ncbi:MAG: hypothetical protein L3J74_12730 [Bacteroidales bacterium]|nr:hypothetical protein [Bacteroidales bacterium]